MNNFGNIKANSQWGTLTIKTSTETVKFGADQPQDRTIDISNETAALSPTGSPLSEEQQAALNSGITAERLADIEDHVETMDGQVEGNRSRITRVEERLSTFDDGIQDNGQVIQELQSRVEELEGILQNVGSSTDLQDINSQIENLRQQVQNLASQKQNKLVSGQSIKTINGRDVLGSGNLEIVGTSSGTSVEPSQVVTFSDIQGMTAGFSQSISQEGNLRATADENLQSRVSNLEGSVANLGSMSRYNILVLTQASYDNISVKDNNTLYFIIEV